MWVWTSASGNELRGALPDLLHGRDAGELEEGLDVSRGACIGGEGRWSRSGHERPVIRCREADDGVATLGDVGELLVELALVSLRIEIAHGGVEGGAVLDAVALGLELGIIVADGERAAAHASHARRAQARPDGFPRRG